jgi:hypothetical protein
MNDKESKHMANEMRKNSSKTNAISIGDLPTTTTTREMTNWITKEIANDLSIN